MKNLKYFAAMLLFASVFVGCQEEEEDVNWGKPIIEFNATKAEIVEGEVTISGTITVEQEGAVIESATATAFWGEESDQIATLSSMAKVNDGSYTFSFTEADLTEILYKVTKIEVVAKVVDGEEDSKSINVELVSYPQSPLSADKTFEWKRVGSNNNPDLSEFGLIWDETKGTAAAGFYTIIKKDAATQFVELTKPQWNSITTLEELQEAVDNATDISEFGNQILNAGKSSDYDIVLAVNVGGTGDYKIINITRLDHSFSDVAGTTLVLKGKYKDGVWLSFD